MFDAKTHFSELVADALDGKTTIVTKNGKPVAEINPVRSDRREELRSAFAAARQIAAETIAENGGGISIEQISAWIKEGQRFR